MTRPPDPPAATAPVAPVAPVAPGAAGAAGAAPPPGAARSPLPEPLVPFPVSAQHAMRPDLRRLEGAAVRLDALAPRYLAAKLARLRACPERCLAAARPAAADLDEALAAALDRLADDAASPAAVVRAAGGWRLALPGIALAHDGWRATPDPPALGGDGADGGDRGDRGDADASAAGIAAFLAARPPLERAAHSIGLALQDDWALMRLDAEGAARAELLHVCFPSGWDPASKAGLDFAAIHAPVADGDAIRATSRALGAAIVHRGPFERHVWTVADDASLSRHPAETRPIAARSIDELFFRCERQVTLPLPALGRALFLIRVHVAPLAEVAADPARRATLAAALRSMTPQVAAYKGLEAVRALVGARW